LTEEMTEFNHFSKSQEHLQTLLPTASAALSMQIQVLSFLHNTLIFFIVLQDLGG
jgi:hypothetical protein